MRRARGPDIDRSDEELVARAAWLHYVGGLTQSAVAERFGIPTTRAHRMIAKAARDGLVRVSVEAEVAACMALEERLCVLFGLSSCYVAPDVGEDEAQPHRALGVAGAQLLQSLLGRRNEMVVGVGHGATIAAAVEAMPTIVAPGAKFISLLGGLTRTFAANPYDVMFRLAEKTGAEAYLMPAPLFANTPADRDILLAQAGPAEIMRLYAEVEVCLLGVGAVDSAGSIARANVFDPDAAPEMLRTRGARAEVLGQFLDAEGNVVSTPYDGRVIAADIALLKGREVHALAGGTAKTAALSAALRSGVFTGLVTDEATARRLVALAERDDALSGVAGCGSSINDNREEDGCTRGKKISSINS